MDLDSTDSSTSSSRMSTTTDRSTIGRLETNTLGGDNSESQSTSSSLSSTSTNTSSSGSGGDQSAGLDGFTLRRRSSNSAGIEYFPAHYNNAVRSSSGNPSTNVVINRRTAAKAKEREKLCTSPVSAIVGTALNQMNLKRSTSAPMINQLGIAKETGQQRLIGFENQKVAAASSSRRDSSSPSTSNRPNNLGSYNNSPSINHNPRETPMEIDAASFATSFLASLNNPRPRRFSASFSPSSPGPAPSRVNQLRHESNNDWETASEKEFIGTMSIAQSWEDLSLESMSMEIPARRSSVSEQLWLSINPGTSSASSSPAASPRILSSRFSPAHSSPSPTRKSFTTRRSLSPIAIRPSVLSIGGSGIGLKRKCDWDSSSSSSNQMDCSPQPAAKRAGGLLSFTQQSPYSGLSGTSSGLSSPITSPLVNHHLLQCPLLPHAESLNSLDTESSVSSISGCAESDSPFFRPVDSPLNSNSDISSSDAPSSHKS